MIVALLRRLIYGDGDRRYIGCLNNDEIDDKLNKKSRYKWY